MEETDKMRALLDAAEDVARAASARGPAGTTIYFISKENMAALTKAITAIRPFYELMGGKKLPRKTNWED